MNMGKTRKRILFALVILAFIASCGILYLNKIYLPKKIKYVIINGIKEATQKEAVLGSVQFSIFKGLVLRDIVIYDGKKAVISIKEGSCTFLILPFFKKNIILPSVKVKSPVVFLERLPDNTFNLGKIFELKGAKAGKPKFNIIVSKLSIIEGRIDFQDDTLPETFAKSIGNLNANLSFSLPNNIKFNLKGDILLAARTEVVASGSFNLIANELVSKISLKNLLPQEFEAYYRNFGISIPQGLIDCSADLGFKDGDITIKGVGDISGLSLYKDKILLKSDANITVDVKYGLEEKKFSFNGDAQIDKTSVSGIDFFGAITEISGKIHFDDKGLFSDKLKANAAGLALEVRARLSNFANPSVDIDIKDLSLNSSREILRNKFKIELPADIKGRAGLSVAIQQDVSGKMRLQGLIDLANAYVKLDKIDSSFEDITGRIEFTQEQLKWTGLSFRYMEKPFTSTGILTGFSSPKVNLAVSSAPLFFNSDFTVSGKRIEITKLTGRYFDSEFLLNAIIDLSNPQTLQMQASGGLDLDLKDTGRFSNKLQGLLEKVKPAGLMRVKFNMEGNVADYKSCKVDAELSSPSVSFYGLKGKDFLLVYKQAQGISEVPSMSMFLYGGTLSAAAALNLNSENLPYWLKLDIKDIKIEELKLDTPAKEKEISGSMQGIVKLNGFSSDLSKLSGEGNLDITEGRLWQLDLLRGLGKLLFAKDFANVVFNEASCGFIVKDRLVFTDSLKLKSSLVELDGSAKIGFDSSLDASIKVHVLDEMAPLTKTLKDVATAIIGQSGSFGVIKISGSLQQPKYKFQPAVVDIIKGLKDAVFGNF